MHFTKTRLIFILSVCVLSLMVSLGNFYKLGVFSANQVHLGLDLRGGSEILLKIDYDEYMKEQLQIAINSLRTEFRKNKVRIVPRLRLDTSNGERTAYVFLSGVEDDTKIKEIVKNVDENLSLLAVDGGLSISYNKDSLNSIKRKLLQQSQEVVRRRVDETGTKEPIIQIQGGDRILVQVPGMESPDELKQVIGKTAKMTFHFADMGVYADNNVPSTVMKVKDRAGNELFVEKEVILNGELLEDASATFNEGKPAVAFTFNSVGAKKFTDITRKNIGRILVVVLDNEIITAPRINTMILGGRGVITGTFTTKEASDMALLLRAGALPTPLEVIEERIVGPSLGEDSIKSGLFACALGFAFVLLFMVLLYRFFGILTDVVLIVNLLVMLAALTLLNATLTLPGIAGLVLSVGMAVDTNVLIFERIKEEYAKTQKVYASIESGFDFAWLTIFDSNITTLLIALILYSFGTGAVKGFALVLAIGIFASLFSGVMLTKLLLSMWLNKTKPRVIRI